MSENQLLHHHEAMEAARRDFQSLWNTKLRMRAIELGAQTERALIVSEIMAWQAFLHALKIRGDV